MHYNEVEADIVKTIAADNIQIKLLSYTSVAAPGGKNDIINNTLSVIGCPTIAAVDDSGLDLNRDCIFLDKFLEIADAYDTPFDTEYVDIPHNSRDTLLSALSQVVPTFVPGAGVAASPSKELIKLMAECYGTQRALAALNVPKEAK
jgi:hypothetical protein